ncbi:hypothetical protein [Bradyrhizobium sp. UFLA05-109]
MPTSFLRGAGWAFAASHGAAARSPIARMKARRIMRGPDWLECIMRVYQHSAIQGMGKSGACPAHQAIAGK